MAERMQLRGRTAVVTGAGSGIGQAIAMVLAHRGCHLALVDVNAASLAGTVAQLPAACRVSQHVVDVASREMVAALPAAVSTVHDRVDLVVNNAWCWGRWHLRHGIRRRFRLALRYQLPRRRAHDARVHAVAARQ
ncbi:SDR family oxidoreductase [Gemmatimonas sp.]|uniref:SDR family oxidoreductase n=1 Tax=Gemmatimonas sp. TaxID=1962908 RepID=UPI003DA3CD48